MNTRAEEGRQGRDMATWVSANRGKEIGGFMHCSNIDDIDFFFTITIERYKMFNQK